VTITNPNQQSQYVIRVDDATRDYMNASTGSPLPEELRVKMSINTHAFPTGIEVPPATHDVLVPDTFALAPDAPWPLFQNTGFQKKRIQLQLTSTPSGR
jgi:hypothetical protein